MGVIVDSSVLIGWERGRLDPAEQVRGREDEAFFLSVISASELLHGVHRATDPGIRAQRSAFVEGVLSRFPILSVDLATARSHSRLWAEMAAQGTMIGLHDSWIAASCLAHGLTLATASLREFERVPGLKVQAWAG